MRILFSELRLILSIYISVVSFSFKFYLTKQNRSYTTYYNNYNNSLATLSKCTERSKFRDFLEHKVIIHSLLISSPPLPSPLFSLSLFPSLPLFPSQETLVKEPLSSLLIRPIQRVPKYVLLLRDWMKNLPFTHPDFETLKKAEVNI